MVSVFLHKMYIYCCESNSFGHKNVAVTWFCLKRKCISIKVICIDYTDKLWLAFFPAMNKVVFLLLLTSLDRIFVVFIHMNCGSGVSCINYWWYR